MDVLLDIPVFGSHIVYVLSLNCLPRILYFIPPLLHVFFDPILNFTPFVFAEERTLPTHHRVVEEHAAVEVVAFICKGGDLVDDFFFAPAFP